MLTIPDIGLLSDYTHFRKRSDYQRQDSLSHHATQGSLRHLIKTCDGRDVADSFFCEIEGARLHEQNTGVRFTDFFIKTQRRIFEARRQSLLASSNDDVGGIEAALREAKANVLESKRHIDKPSLLVNGSGAFIIKRTGVEYSSPSDNEFRNVATGQFFMSAMRKDEEPSREMHHGGFPHLKVITLTDDPDNTERSYGAGEVKPYVEPRLQGEVFIPEVLEAMLADEELLRLAFNLTREEAHNELITKFFYDDADLEKDSGTGQAGRNLKDIYADLYLLEMVVHGIEKFSSMKSAPNHISDEQVLGFRNLQAVRGLEERIERNWQIASDAYGESQSDRANQFSTNGNTLYEALGEASQYYSKWLREFDSAN